MENLQHQFNRYFVDNGATEWWLTGLKTTLLVTVIALCIGVVLGLLIALIRSTHEQTGKLKLLNIVARVYHKSSNPGTEPYIRCTGSASLRSDLLSDSCYDSDLFHGQTGKETA